MLGAEHARCLHVRIPKAHLKNADFLDTENYPTAKFASTSVTAGDDGMYNVVGDFTLMGKTNSITIPVKMTSSDQGVVAMSELTLDRTSFGMNKKTEQVSKEVAITLAVGQPTTEFGGGGGAGGGKGKGKGKGKGGRGGFDPTAMFEGMDADGDGKLTGAEIPERMQQWAGQMDTDGDKSITLKELQAAMANRGGGGRGKGGGGKGGGKGGGGGARKSRPGADN